MDWIKLETGTKRLVQISNQDREIPTSLSRVTFARRTVDEERPKVSPICPANLRQG